MNDKETPYVMMLHGAIIGFVLYLAMFYGLKQSHDVAQDRSIVLGLMISIYMIVFGHHIPPKTINDSFK